MKIDELTEIIVKDMEEVYGLLKQAQKNRAVGGTLLNEVSSRSHMIICITVRQSRVVNELKRRFKKIFKNNVEFSTF